MLFLRYSDLRLIVFQKVKKRGDGVISLVTLRTDEFDLQIQDEQHLKLQQQSQL